GSPIIYYGDEIGMGDNIWLDDRNGVRTPMQWDFNKHGGFSEADDLYAPAISDEVYGYQRVNVVQQQANPESLWYTVRHMLSVRRNYRAFGRGTFEFALPENEAILGYWRALDPDDESGGEPERFLVLANLTGVEQTSELDLGAYAGIAPVDVLTGHPWSEIGAQPYLFTLPPYGYYWLRLR
ncbi:MAG TPA: alpha-glucosidase C-terminal domain-containing protein, partial [Aggregatilineaceae bacterium]|nr:alpha-glucosidase C-terminal domain-containing protein [Aggregatilineaceae bacterium]